MTKDPASPCITAELATCGQARKVEGMGSLLAVRSSGGLGLIDITDPEEPVGLGMVWIIDAGRFLWTEEGTMDQCMHLSEIDQTIIDVVTAFGRFGDTLDSEGHYLYTTSRKKLMSFEVKNSFMPELLDYLTFGRQIKAMRVYNGYAYLNTKRDEPHVIDISDPSLLELAGAHDIEWWVKGLEIVDERVYLLHRNKIKVAQVYPAGGWIW